MMKCLHSLLLRCIPFVVLSLFLVPSTAWGYAQQPTRPFPLGSTRGLLGAAAIQPKDVWGVGYFANITISGTIVQTMVEHWDGTLWIRIPGPNPSSNYAVLSGVAALSHNDVWAVGATGHYQPLIEHWNGSSWSIVSSPTVNGLLIRVSAVSRNNLWAVGASYSGTLPQALIEHWNGKSWSIITSPSVPSADSSSLNSVTALAANNIWAAGFSSSGGQLQPLIEHWNGKSWSIVSTPTIPTGGQLSGIAAVSKKDIWAVGQTSALTTLTLHWNGKKWNLVASPNNPSGNNVLRDVAASSSKDVWAIGTIMINNRVSGALILHWDGKQWQEVSATGVSPTSQLNAITRISQNDAWAVGYTFANNENKELRLHWDGSSWLSM